MSARQDKPKHELATLSQPAKGIKYQVITVRDMNTFDVKIEKVM